MDEFTSAKSWLKKPGTGFFNILIEKPMEQGMEYISAFLFAFTLVVIVHELGHLLAAKALGVKVYEFSIGFPFSPKIATFFRLRETEFTLRLLPLGGFVAFSKEGEGDGSEYLVLHKWKRALIAFAGPAFNIILAFAALALSAALGEGQGLFGSSASALHSISAGVQGFLSLFGPGLLENLSGPIGIAVAAGNAAHSGTAGFLAFTGMLSLSLAIFNLIPFPALDGGQLVMLAAESLRKKDFSPAFHGAVSAIGMLLFIGLTLFVSYKDIYRLAV